MEPVLSKARKMGFFSGNDPLPLSSPPLRTQTLPVMRVYGFDDEVHCVVRRSDGTPLAAQSYQNFKLLFNDRD